MSVAGKRRSWRAVFTKISCQIPHLNRFSLEGGFNREPHPQIRFGFSGAELLFSKAMEKFVAANALDAIVLQVAAAPREKVVRVALEALQVIFCWSLRAKN